MPVGIYRIEGTIHITTAIHLIGVPSGMLVLVVRLMWIFGTMPVLSLCLRVLRKQ